VLALGFGRISGLLGAIAAGGIPAAAIVYHIVPAG